MQDNVWIVEGLQERKTKETNIFVDENSHQFLEIQVAEQGQQKHHAMQLFHVFANTNAMDMGTKDTVFHTILQHLFSFVRAIELLRRSI